MGERTPTTVLTAPGTFTSGAEGPACDRDGFLYAVNWHHQGSIGRVAPDGTSELFVDLPEGRTGNGIRFDRAGRTMFVADWTGHAVLAVDLASREVTVWAEDDGLNQPNDLAIRGDDMIFCSDPDFAQESGQIWRVDPDRSMVLLETGMSTTNGIEVAPAGDVLYVNESHSRSVWAYDLDPHGAVSGKRLHVRFDEHLLDGMRCDAEGSLYVARFGAGLVAQVSPAGEVMAEFTTSGTNVTNVAFGGSDGRTCYVTVADTGTVECFRTEVPGQSWVLFQS